MQENNQRYVPIMMPSRSGVCYFSTISSIMHVASALGTIVEAESHATTISAARTFMFRTFKEKTGLNSVRGFLVDSDMYIHFGNIEKLTEICRTADEKHYNFVIPYRINEQYSSILLNEKELMPNQKAAELKNWQRVKAAGLGFYYGDLPLSYNFHTNREGAAEDWFFFTENKLSVRVNTEIKIYHVKPILLGIKDNLFF